MKAPASYRLEFWDGAAWREVPGQTRTPERPAGAALNRVTFPALTTTKIRLVFGNPPGAYVGVTELQAWSPAAGDATVDVTVSGQARSGDPAEVTTTFVNRGRTPATRVTASPAVPPGWSAEPVGSPKAHVVRPGGEFAVRWRVAPPAGTAPSPGAHPVRAAVEFDGSARAVSPYAQVTVGLDPDAYGKVEADDDFAADTSAGYTLYKPEGGEALPAVTVGGGRFAGGGAQPFFGLAAGPAALSSADAISVVTAGEFAGTGSPEDSVFVGWVKDAGTYVTAWYNNTRKQSGINVRVGGRFLDTPGDAPLTLKPGDRFALALSGDTITSFAYTGGQWRPLRTADIGGTLATPQAREGFRYGFGLRGTSGTIAVAGLEGRSSS
ncbi:NEW3 domain-containing protein [Microbispora hainanensis]|uniref:NEW3 domain-containing protein n=1 Tax=Microbispora hainanensis TaxID=568844 RepID=A0ABZ1SWQ2_9ACTN|nr:NEW3 domain-containing protein [Microbispora hainanensis]